MTYHFWDGPYLVGEVVGITDGQARLIAWETGYRFTEAW